MLKTGSLNSSTKFSIYQEEEEEVKISNSLAKHQVIMEERKPLSAIKASKDIGFEPDSCKVTFSIKFNLSIFSIVLIFERDNC